MTDNEIIKALECCANNPNECVCYENECPLFGQKCIDILSKNALDLINRQKEENQNLEIELKAMRGAANSYKAEIESKNDLIHRQSDVISEQKEKLESIYSEAIKEFAERLKEYVESYDVTTGYRVTIVNAVEEETIDNLVKEMVGEG